jgi:hypothetical protein
MERPQEEFVHALGGREADMSYTIGDSELANFLYYARGVPPPILGDLLTPYAPTSAIRWRVDVNRLDRWIQQERTALGEEHQRHVFEALRLSATFKPP